MKEQIFDFQKAARDAINKESRNIVAVDKEKISFFLYEIKLRISPHTSAESVAAIDHYIAEVYKAATGEEGPEWMI